MNEEESKICSNCKREIPAVNFTIHTVHCSRNIRVCPVCKEPVPQTELQDHHDRLHKLLPCKHCGESVCGTDLEDHIRDSCGHTIKSCRFCELELPRNSLPAHEAYCGVRTEQCPECLEWVMIKYRQLHLDSNHGFLRLDDDPIPQARKEPPKANPPKIYNTPKPSNVRPSTSNGNPRPAPGNYTNFDQDRPRTVIRYFNASSDDGPSSSSSTSSAFPPWLYTQPPAKTMFRSKAKRTNDQPQVNTAVVPKDKVNKNLSGSRGAVTKRPAPRPPPSSPTPGPAPLLSRVPAPVLGPTPLLSPVPPPPLAPAGRSAMQRVQDEERRRQEQTAYNLSVGLPPVLSAAAKLDKLRKLDALHNRETAEVDYSNRLQGRVWMDMNIPTGNVLGSGADHDTQASNAQHLAVEKRKINKKPSQSDAHRPIPHTNETGFIRQPFNENFRRLPQTSEASSMRRNDNNSRADPHATEDLETREEFRNLTPMSPQEFMERFSQLQLARDMDDEDIGERANASNDRFSEIKSSLRELRRGLNEVTAPYNSSGSSSNGNNSGSEMRRGPPSPVAAAGEEAVHLPCEFCGMLVPAQNLVQHQTGCRPDLAQLRPRSVSPLLPLAGGARGAPPPPPPLSPPPSPTDPVIPCEFCAESLPVYLITEHQERCRRDAQLLYPD